MFQITQNMYTTIIFVRKKNLIVRLGLKLCIPWQVCMNAITSHPYWQKHNKCHFGYGISLNTHPGISFRCSSIEQAFNGGQHLSKLLVHHMTSQSSYRYENACHQRNQIHKSVWFPAIEEELVGKVIEMALSMTCRWPCCCSNERWLHQRLHHCACLMLGPYPSKTIPGI